MQKLAYSALLLGLISVGLMGCPSSKTEKPDDQTKTLTTQPAKARQYSEPTLGQEAGVTAFKVGDLVVLHKPTPANQVVSAQLYFIGGAMRLTEDTQGIEKLAMSVASQGGTKSTAKDDFNAKLDAVGASVGAFSDRDYSGLAMKTIVPYFDEVFTLFAQAALEPAMPEAEIELEKKRQIAQYEALFENNDSLVGYMASKLLFKGHPYENTQLGTDKTLPGFDQAQLMAHHKRILDPTNMLLVVVGNISKEQLEAQVQKSFGQLKGSGQPITLAPPKAPTQPALSSETKAIPTNYIFGLFAAPAPDHPDYAPMVVAMDYLADRLFEEVRTKRNLTYAVSSGLSQRASNYGYLYVTAVEPQTTLPVMYEEIDRLASTMLEPEALKETLNVFVTGYYMGLETNSSQASMLADAQILKGDWRQASKTLDRLRQVSPQDVQRVVKTYVKNVQFGVVGPKEFKQDDPLFKR